MISDLSSPDLLIKVRQFKVAVMLVDLVHQDEVIDYANKLNEQLRLILSTVDEKHPGMADLETEAALKLFLRFMNCLARLRLVVNNVGGEPTPADIDQQANFFFQIGFSSTPNAIWLAYLNEGNKYDQKLSAIAEELLGKAMSYFTGLLEDPNIWTSDMMGFGGEAEEGVPDLESHLHAEIFTASRVLQLLQSVAQKFLILTPDEIQKWQDDSLEFFINQKEQANDIRGNFLRDKSNDLIAALGLRYGSMFEEFCTKIVGELQTEELKSSHVDS